MKFGENLKKVRKLKKMSQEELADKVGVSRQSVSKWETSESYPEINNILQLCKIFHCNINDLINDSIIDIDLLDEEVKMSVVKLKKEKQNKIKKLSKAIQIIAKIGSIATTICIPIIILVIVIVPFICNSIKVVNNKVSFNNNSFIIKENNNKIEITFNNMKIASGDDIEVLNKIKDVYNHNSNTAIIISIEISIAILVIYLILIRFTLKYLENLFINIHNLDTPFTLENVDYIKKIACFLIIAIIIPNISGIIMEVILNVDLNISFGLFNIIEILFLFSLAYIFEYGYEIQLDTNGKMYGEENEQD